MGAANTAGAAVERGEWAHDQAVVYGEVWAELHVARGDRLAAGIDRARLVAGIRTLDDLRAAALTSDFLRRWLRSFEDDANGTLSGGIDVTAELQEAWFEQALFVPWAWAELEAWVPPHILARARRDPGSPAGVDEVQWHDEVLADLADAGYQLVEAPELLHATLAFPHVPAL